jgi:hypothetical protein
MRVCPSPLNHNQPAGLVLIHDLAVWQAEHGDWAPETEEQARAICARWCLANDRWVYEYVGTELKYQTTFRWEENG